jgi:hypothetical protein
MYDLSYDNFVMLEKLRTGTVFIITFKICHPVIRSMQLKSNNKKDETMPSRTIHGILSCHPSPCHPVTQSSTHPIIISFCKAIIHFQYVPVEMILTTFKPENGKNSIF